MSDDLSAAEHLFDECRKINPDLIKIDKYINECRSNHEDIDT